MSTHGVHVKCQNGVKACAEKSAFHSHTREERISGTLHDGNENEQWLNRTSLEHIQTNKNLCIEQKIHLKSRQDWEILLEDHRHSLDQPRFTSCFSLKFPSKKSDGNNTGDPTEAQIWDVVKKTASVQQPELCEKTLPPDSFKQSATERHEDQDVLESFFEKGDADDPSQNHCGHDISSHRSTAGTQHGLGLCQQTTGNCSQRLSAKSPSSSTNLPVSESTAVERESGVTDPQKGNAEEGLSYSNPIHLREDISSEANTDFQAHARSPGALKRVLSLPSFTPAYQGRKLETESNLINPAAVMFTSTLVSVLAPHWSGRLRRHKRGGTEVEQDAQVSGRSVSDQDVLQQSFPETVTQQGVEKLDKTKRPAVPSRSFAEWEKDSSSPNLTRTFQSKRAPLDSNIDFGSSGPDPGQMPRSSLSPRDKPASQSEEKGKSFSLPHSRPTTSSLLLSLRRIHERNINVDSSELDKQPSSSGNDQTLPSKSILRVSQPRSPLVSPDDPRNVAFVPYINPTTSEKTKFSPKIREREECRPSLMICKREFDISSRTFSRKYSHLGSSMPTGQSNTDSTNLNNPSVSSPNGIFDSPNSCISSTDNTNSNFVFPQTDWNTGNLNFHISDHDSKRQVSQASAKSPDHRPSTSVQTASTHNTANVDKPSTINNPGTTMSTTTYISHTRPNKFNPPYSALKSRNRTQSSQKNTENSASSNVCPEKLSPSPKTFTNSLMLTPRKTPFAMEETKSSPVRQDCLNSHLDRSSLDTASHLSPSRPLRRVLSPSIYSYLRETSPTLAPKTSSFLTSSNPQTTSLKQNGDQNAGTLMFTFDVSPTQDSHPSNVPQSLPPDFSRRPRLSKSPYSTLISARPALNSPLYSLSYSPASCQHGRSASFDSSATHANPSIAEKSSYSFIRKDKLVQRSPKKIVGSDDKSLKSETGHTSSASVDTINIARISPGPSIKDHQASNIIQSTAYQRQCDMVFANATIPKKSSYSLIHKDSLIQRSPNKTVSTGDKSLKSETGQTSSSSLHTNNIARISSDSNLIDWQAANLIQSTTHPKHSDALIKNNSKEGQNDMFSSRRDNNSTYAAQALSTDRVTETVQIGLETKQAHETLEDIQSPVLKKPPFLLRRKKDNVLSSSQAEKEGLGNQCVKKGETTGLKSGHRMDLVLNCLKQTLGVKRSEDNNVTVEKKSKNFNRQPADLKASESTKKQEETRPESQTLTSANSSNSQITMLRESYSSDPVSGFTSNNERHENSSMVEPRRYSDENGNRFLNRPPSPNRIKSRYNQRYATMPQDRKSTSTHSPSLYSFEFDSADAQHDNVFYVFPTRRKTTSLCETDNVPEPGSVGGPCLTRQLSTSCANLMHGLDRGRSVSVSSVVSGRPSGPGRISTGSRTGSTSDLTSMEDFRTRSSHSSICSSADSPDLGLKASSTHPFQNISPGFTGGLTSSGRLWSPVNLETSPHSLDSSPPPTPPASPPFSPTNRRMAQIPSTSSTGSRTSQDSLSPRMFLPSRKYTSTLSAFEESDSETTTDDEYYLNSDDDDDDENETEL